MSSCTQYVLSYINRPLAVFAYTHIHTQKHVHKQKQLKWQQLQKHVLKIAAADCTVWTVGWGSWWQTCPGWRAEVPIFNRSQHAHITTAVPTSLVRPLSGIAVLKEPSPSPQLCCFTLYSLCLRLLAQISSTLASFSFVCWHLRDTGVVDLLP